jgi:hypothetical protein
MVLEPEPDRILVPASPKLCDSGAPNTDAINQLDSASQRYRPDISTAALSQ